MGKNVVLKKGRVDKLTRTGLGGVVLKTIGVKLGDEVQFALDPEGRVVVEKASE